MAASDARPIPRKNTAFRVTLPIFDADGDLVTGATGLDSEVSLDGAAFADCTNEATEIGASGIYYLDLTAGEMNADTVVVLVKTTSSGAKTTPLIFYPEEAGDLRADLTTQAKADVNAEVLDVLNVDTFAEPAAAPAATTTLRVMLHWLFTLARNKRVTTAVLESLRNDADSADIATASLSDNGVTFTRGEWA